MSKKVVKLILYIGIIGVIVFGISSIYSMFKLEESDRMIRAGGGTIWVEHKESYKTQRNISIPSLIVSVIFTGSGLYLKNAGIVSPKNEIENSQLLNNIPTKIKELSKLKDEGVITEKEFTEKKKELLAKI